MNDRAFAGYEESHFIDRFRGLTRALALCTSDKHKQEQEEG